jgi:hypothetical protein
MYLKFDIGGICGSLVLCNMYMYTQDHGISIFQGEKNQYFIYLSCKDCVPVPT